VWGFAERCGEAETERLVCCCFWTITVKLSVRIAERSSGAAQTGSFSEGELEKGAALEIAELSNQVHTCVLYRTVSSSCSGKAGKFKCRFKRRA
jgi:hypothetical protein